MLFQFLFLFFVLGGENTDEAGKERDMGYGEVLMLIAVQQTVVKELRKDAEEVRAELEMAES